MGLGKTRYPVSSAVIASNSMGTNIFLLFLCCSWNLLYSTFFYQIFPTLFFSLILDTFKKCKVAVDFVCTAVAAAAAVAAADVLLTLSLSQPRA